MAQFLSGPSAALRLADMGARVIKIERPGSGDICRSLYLSDTDIGGDSTLFHAINRNKESLSADLKNPTDRDAILRLVGHADIVVQNFRPGVADRLGLGPKALTDAYPELIVGSISGYGDAGPWAGLPGQDLLTQALSGAMWLSGDADDGPVPIGLSIADMLAGHILVEGLLAGLVRRGRTGRGAIVSTSLLEAMTDFQFEVLTTHLNDGGRLPQRAARNNAHAYLGAPYGVYRTSDGWLALAMTPLTTLAPLLGLDLPDAATESNGFAERDAVKEMIAKRLEQNTTDGWFTALRTHDIWCAPVLDWPEMLASEAFRRLDMLQQVTRGESAIATTRAPWRIDGTRPADPRGAPDIGEHSDRIRAEFGLDQ
ncbi:CoA transferase [Stakelama sp. CBK3Z-3]|uniref:CoA transferase n=2 Tax=Stakelama flava TaxID=2860338 RepID=A0ABS6XNH3_9SPHN|nr:CoA transferase [Stakelama flava]